MYKNFYSLLFAVLLFPASLLVAETHTVDIAIIGGGPAGCAAGIYVGGARLDGGTVMFDRNPGGCLTGAACVVNWPAIMSDTGIAIMDRFLQQVKALGVDIVEDIVTQVDFSQYPYKLVTAEHGDWSARSVIIATGSSPRRLGVTGEQEYWGCGVATCALCEAALYEGLDVAVVGAGDSAYTKALLLAKYARTVTIYGRQRVCATRVIQESLETVKDRVKVVLNREIVEIIGDGEKVTALRVRDVITGDIELVPMDGVFLAIGQSPNTELFKDVLPLTASGHIIVSGGGVLTSLPGVFAAGTVTDIGQKYNQAFIEAGFGGQAGIEAVNYIRYGSRQ